MNMLKAKKHKFFRSKEVHFWIRIWSDWGYGLRAWTGVCDDRNTANGDGCKTSGSDGETPNIIHIAGYAKYSQ